MNVFEKIDLDEPSGNSAERKPQNGKNGKVLSGESLPLFDS